MSDTPKVGGLATLIFASRWLQAPLYFGLVVSQIVYVVQFLKELWHLIDYAINPSHVPSAFDGSAPRP